MPPRASLSISACFRRHRTRIRALHVPGSAAPIKGVVAGDEAVSVGHADVLDHVPWRMAPSKCLELHGERAPTGTPPGNPAASAPHGAPRNLVCKIKQQPVRTQLWRREGAGRSSDLAAGRDVLTPALARDARADALPQAALPRRCLPGAPGHGLKTMRLGMLRTRVSSRAHPAACFGLSSRRRKRRCSKGRARAS